jgi:hypothetical protein
MEVPTLEYGSFVPLVAAPKDPKKKKKVVVVDECHRLESPIDEAIQKATVESPTAPNQS